MNADVELFGYNNLLQCFKFLKSGLKERWMFEKITGEEKYCIERKFDYTIMNISIIKFIKIFSTFLHTHTQTQTQTHTDTHTHTHTHTHTICILEVHTVLMPNDFPFQLIMTVRNPHVNLLN